MRVTALERVGADVLLRVTSEPAWRSHEYFEDQRLQKVDVVDIQGDARATLQMVRIGAGGHFPMHSTPDVAACQVMKGRGQLRLPDGEAVTFQSPEVFIFQPDTLHEWCNIVEDTYLSVCLVHPV